MNFKKIIFMFFFFLSGCNLYGIPDESLLERVETSFNKDVFAKGGKAAVVIDGQNNASTPSLKVYNYYVYEDGKGDVFTFSTGGTPQIYMLSPGTYKLKDFYIYGSETFGNSRIFVDIKFTNEIESSFTVNAGEVLYLGKVGLKITAVKTSAFDKFFNRGAGRNKIDYETNLFDEYKNISSDFLISVKEKTGKDITVKMMTWNRLEKNNE